MHVPPALFASLILLMATEKTEKGLKCGTSSGHITNLKQSIFNFDIYDMTSACFSRPCKSTLKSKQTAMLQGSVSKYTRDSGFTKSCRKLR